MNTDLTVTGLNEAQRLILEQRTPAEAIKYRQGRGNTKLAYVSHTWVTRVLNEAFGFRWSWDVTDTMIMPDLLDPHEVIVRGRLTVTTPDGGTVVKEQFGSTDVKRYKDGGVISLGDDLKAASSDALKKAASLLGVALDLYGAADDPLPGEEPSPKPATKPAVQKSDAKSSAPAPAAAHKPVQRNDFDELPGHERSAYTKPANGNGHAKVEVETASRPKWKSPDEAKAWAMGLGAFDHDKHCQNAYDKLRRTALASEKPPTSAAEFFDLWYADVIRRLAEKHAEIDRLAAGSEIPQF